MKSQTEIVEAFRDGAELGQASHVFIDGDTLYSYGHHFPLAVRYRNGDGYRFLVNGDRYSQTTSTHQARCFKLGPQIPFSALAAAKINPYRVEIVARREDAWHEVPDPTPEEPEHVREEHTLGAVLLEHRGRFFLSSLDDNESWRRRSYFLSELPREVQTVEAAYESLVPDEVRAWREGKENPPERRQGEWFFLPSELETRHLPRPTYRMAQLLETAHYVTELRQNGDLYSRGVVRHRPEQRRAQHGILRLGPDWHRAVRNLALGSWNATGLVD